MRARLFARTGPFRGTSFELGAETVVGRKPSCEVVLPDPLISGRHGRIYFDSAEGCFMLEDLGSSNGTFLAGMRVSEPEKLGPLEVVGFAGAFEFIFQSGEGEAAAPPAQPGAASSARPPTVVGPLEDVLPAALLQALAPAEEPRLAPGRGTLVGDADDLLPAILRAARAAAPPPPAPSPAFALRVDVALGRQETYELPRGEHLIGRHRDCTVAVDNPTLSRQHARLLVGEDGVRVADLKSTNRTFVAGQPIVPEVEVEIGPGTRLRFGSVEAELLRREPSAREVP